jgi:hypothetical protein
VSIALDTMSWCACSCVTMKAQFEAAKRLVDQAAAPDQPVLIVLRALLETEWVLRSRYKLDKASIATAFGQLSAYCPGP